MTPLQQACKLFVERYREYGRPRDAEGQCFGASCLLAEVCDEVGGLDVIERCGLDWNGLPDPDSQGWDVVRVSMIPGWYDVDFSRYKEHWVLRVNGDTIVDPTARQFNPSAPFPLVVPLSAVVLDERG